jgi:hypothetical protein
MFRAPTGAPGRLQVGNLTGDIAPSSGNYGVRLR